MFVVPIHRYPDGRAVMVPSARGKHESSWVRLLLPDTRRGFLTEFRRFRALLLNRPKRRSR